MILDNGTIQAIEITQGGLVNGIPQEAQTTYGEPIPCHIVANQNNQKGSVKDSTFTQMTFSVWIDFQPQTFTAKHVRLTDNKGIVLGDFEVQSIEHSDLTLRTKITV
ncbi:hypothetical protein [Capnocytophaga canimorsus]|uniref:hypothetical protein n=1 Tax=Capnocytophaga canimorsus TaxID=28188 RepID=UPI0037D0B6D6